MARVLETLGELARVSGLGLRPHVSEILPLIIEALNDASNSKKAVAITTLGQVPPPPSPAILRVRCPILILFLLYLPARVQSWQACNISCVVYELSIFYIFYYFSMEERAMDSRLFHHVLIRGKAARPLVLLLASKMQPYKR
jgi:hypothetical protein